MPVALVMLFMMLRSLVGFLVMLADFIMLAMLKVFMVFMMLMV